MYLSKLDRKHYERRPEICSKRTTARTLGALSQRVRQRDRAETALARCRAPFSRCACRNGGGASEKRWASSRRTSAHASRSSTTLRLHIPQRSAVGIFRGPVILFCSFISPRALTSVRGTETIVRYRWAHMPCDNRMSKRAGTSTRRSADNQSCKAARDTQENQKLKVLKRNIWREKCARTRCVCGHERSNI